jgi:hypothetical protein
MYQSAFSRSSMVFCRILLTGTADVFHRVPQVVWESLVFYEVDHFDLPGAVMAGMIHRIVLCPESICIHIVFILSSCFL